MKAAEREEIQQKRYSREIAPARKARKLLREAFLVGV
jgi:hypothetical protein